jgi:hypothetical protein
MLEMLPISNVKGARPGEWFLKAKDRKLRKEGKEYQRYFGQTITIV